MPTEIKDFTVTEYQKISSEDENIRQCTELNWCQIWLIYDNIDEINILYTHMYFTFSNAV